MYGITNNRTTIIQGAFMQHLFTISALIFVQLFFACSSGLDLEREKMNLLQTDIEFARVSVASDAAEAFNQFLDNECLMLSNGSEPLMGREKIYKQMKNRAGSYTLSWIPQRAEVAAAADMGWTWGNFILDYMASDGTQKISYGKYVNVWKRQPDGQWKVLVDMGNDSPAPAN
jgi:ketosteroid isomerase-like protein